LSLKDFKTSCHEMLQMMNGQTYYQLAHVYCLNRKTMEMQCNWMQ